MGRVGPEFVEEGAVVGDDGFAINRLGADLSGGEPAKALTFGEDSVVEFV